MVNLKEDGILNEYSNKLIKMVKWEPIILLSNIDPEDSTFATWRQQQHDEATQKAKELVQRKNHNAVDGVEVMQRQGLTTIETNLTVNDDTEEGINIMKEIAQKKNSISKKLKTIINKDATKSNLPTIRLPAKECTDRFIGVQFSKTFLNEMTNMSQDFIGTIDSYDSESKLYKVCVWKIKN